MPSRRLLPLLRPLAALALAGALAGAGCAAPGGSLPSPSATPGWAEVEALLDEQRLAAALERLAAIEAAARSRRDDRELARALVRRAQIQTALGGYAAAVEELRSRPWPEAPGHRAAVELYDAQALLSYLDAYGWEIRQRERVVAGDELDLERWTADQITAEADRAFARVWARRLALGEVPVAEFELLAANDYPAGIRPSVRDAVSYLWSERLADSAHWSPSELEETWKLDLAALAEGSVPPPALSPAEAAQHPLVTLAAVLGDLERWHRERGELGGALEARLERLGRLHDALAAESDRDRLREALAASLPAFRRHPWWAMGMARLAAFWRASSAPDALVRAREVAVAGERAYPGEPGSSACRRQREEIEAPAYGLQAMAVDAAARRSVEISHRNLERLHLRAYRLEPRPFAAQPVTWEGWSEERARPLLGGRPAASWSVELPETADHRDHRTYTAPPLAERGRYLVVASADPGFGRRGNQLQAVELQIGDLVLLHGWARRGGRSRLAVHALSGTSGEPLAAAEAELYRWQWERPPELVARRTTDADGGVDFEAPGDERRGGGFAIVVRHRGEEAVWQQGHWPAGRELDDPAALATLVFTDRAVYRPGQTLLWKTLSYSGRRARGELRAAAGRRIEVRLLDANGERVAAAAATTNPFGTASGEFELPAGRLLGEWRVETDFGGAALVAVEQYKRPTFEVTLARPRDEPRLNRPVELEGEARYHFGLPVAGGRVAWRVVREPLWEWGWRAVWPPPAAPRTIASGRAAANADGKFSIRFTPEADERERSGCGCFRFRVEAELTDEGGETRSGELALGLGWVGVRLRLPGEPFLVTPADEPRWSLRREDLDGEPRAGETSWQIVELEQPERAPLPSELPERVDTAHEPFATPGDRLRPRWAAAPEAQEILGGWKARREVARGALRHGEDGAAALELPALGPGAYRLVAETRDRHGEPARLEHGFVVVAAAPARLALPLELGFAEPTVSVGGTARLFVHSGVPGQTILVELLRGDELIERRRLVAGRDPVWIEIAVGAGDRGGLGARAALVSDHQLVQRTAALAVPWDDKGLTVELSSFRDRLTPGASESFRVTVRGPGSEPLAAGAAELVAAMYDRSLDLFRAHSVPLASQLYPAFGAPEALASGLGGRGPVWSDSEGWGELAAAPSFRADELVALDPYGVGGPGERGGPIAYLERRMAVESAPAAEQQTLLGTASDARQTKAAAAPVAQLPPAADLRSNFSETAFWRPHLVTDATGGVAVEFRVPDALTAWKVWVSAWTRDLAAGYVEREVRTAKELMVRPYLPRFLREGDAARLVVVVNNASASELAGEVRFAIVDPETGDDRSADLGLPAGGGRAAFTAAAGRGAELAFPVTAPRGVRPLAVRVEAAAGGLADGELRPLPLLPSRLHLAQSRFAALRDGERRELVFEDLRRSDPTRVDERLVVTLDGQLFYGMLDALPYLVDYPYECTEQTMNRYLSTAVLGSLFDRHPAVGRMAARLAARETRWERFDAADPNRRLALEETPWLREARGGGEDEALLRVLDPAVARAVRADSLARLERAQLPSGAFPWFPGGPPSPYMTLYLMAGFARAAEFGDQVPRPLLERGWSYLAREIERDWWRHALAENCCWELLTFANYVASSYPDPSLVGDVLPAARRREILDFSFAHRKEHAPQSKLQLALTLHRMGRAGDARRVLDAVMDSAKSDRDLGTFWAPEERAWLWYNDTLETHAWALRALSEITPADPRRAGLVQWLFLNKKLGHWKSTRATAEILYSLAHHLAAENLLGAREEIAVTVGGATHSFVFEPDAFTGKRNRIVLEGAEIVPARDATTVVEPRTRGTAFASVTWQFSTEELPAAASGDLFRVERRWFRRLKQGEETTLEPLAEGAALAVGDELEVQLTIRARAAAEFVHLRDPRAAGLEPDTSRSGWRWDLGLAHYEETRDSGTNFFFETLPAGEYTLKYRLRAAVAGSFRAAPAELQSMYAPEFVAYSAGSELTIAPPAR